MPVRNHAAEDTVESPGSVATPPAGSDLHASTWSVVLATLAPSAVLLVVTAAGGGLVTFLPLVRPHGVLATGALLVYGSAAALARWRAGVLADRIGAKLLLPGALLVTAFGMLCVAAGLLGAPAGPNGRLPWDTLLLAGALLFGAGYGGVQNLTLVIAFAKAGPVRQANASAVWNAAFDAGTAIGRGRTRGTCLDRAGPALVFRGHGRRRRADPARGFAPRRSTRPAALNRGTGSWRAGSPSALSSWPRGRGANCWRGGHSTSAIRRAGGRPRT